MFFRKVMFIAAMLPASLASAGAYAQVAGAQPLSVTVEVSQILLKGWSVKKSVLGKSVYNDDNIKVGVVRDLIVAPDGSVSAAILAAGSFLGVKVHDVAVPVTSFHMRNGNLYLPGASKAALLATPAFQYARIDSPSRPKSAVGKN